MARRLPLSFPTSDITLTQVSNLAKIKVLLAEDHAVVREALSALLARYDEIDVVGGATDGRSAVDLARTLKPDVLLMDLAMRVSMALTPRRRSSAAIQTSRF